MLNRFRWFRRLAVELPQQLRLAYCLLRDPRVPLYTRLGFAGGMGLVLSPWFDLPESIPVLGELDVLALSLLAIRLFIAACPDDVVVDQEQLIIEQRSRFDDDVRRGERIATAIYHRIRPEAGEVVESPARNQSAELEPQRGVPA